MQCSFCGNNLEAGKECNCVGYQQFKSQQGKSPMAPPSMAPPIAPPPMLAPPAAPPSMAKPPLAPPPIAPPSMVSPTAPPPMSPPQAPPSMGKPPMAPPPQAPPSMEKPPMAPPPQAPMAPPPIAPPSMEKPPMAPPMAPPPIEPPSMEKPPMAPPIAPPSMVPPPAPPSPIGQQYQNQQVPPPEGQQFQNQSPPPAPIGQQYQNTQPPVQNMMSFEDAKKMTREAGAKVSSFWYHVKKMLGMYEEEVGTGDPFERNQKIVPQISKACEGEIPVKQYDVVNFRSRLQGLWAEGKIQITNKRVIFRAAGKSIIGRTTLQQEYIIDEIAGIEIAKGVRFSFIDFFVTLILLVPLVVVFINTIISALMNANDTVGVIIGIVLGIGIMAPYVLLKKNLFIKALSSFASASTFISMQYKSEFFIIIGGILAIISLVVLFLFALKPSVSIAIMSKAGTGSPISMRSPSHFRLERASEMLPAKDIEAAQKELGAIISDIQKLGDYGIEKWLS